jgi:oligoribonuclease NrnB/cAMP/cGMP phosphodiesterase (DHH superfamily)
MQEIKNKENIMLCLYHENCTDGTGAAWAVREWAKENQIEILYQSVQYGDAPPVVAGLDIIIVDFSFPRATLVEMHQKASSLIVIDHHKTAKAELAGLDFCIFDMNKAGCILTWEYFFPNTAPPELFYYLQDRDLWRWELPLSREVNAALRSYPPLLSVWDEFMTSAGLDKLKAEGKAIVRYQQQQIDMALARPIPMAEIGGYQVPCINCTHLISELGNELAKGHPFAALYFDIEDKRVFSLRSSDEGEDVSKIAKMYGGGGHRNAAGFSIKKPEIFPK